MDSHRYTYTYGRLSPLSLCVSVWCSLVGALLVCGCGCLVGLLGVGRVRLPMGGYGRHRRALLTHQLSPLRTVVLWRVRSLADADLGRRRGSLVVLAVAPHSLLAPAAAAAPQLALLAVRRVAALAVPGAEVIPIGAHLGWALRLVCHARAVPHAVALGTLGLVGQHRCLAAVLAGVVVSVRALLRDWVGLLLGADSAPFYCFLRALGGGIGDFSLLAVGQLVSGIRAPHQIRSLGNPDAFALGVLVASGAFGAHRDLLDSCAIAAAVELALVAHWCGLAAGGLGAGVLALGVALGTLGNLGHRRDFGAGLAVALVPLWAPVLHRGRLLL
mmetsp:Transcript_41032/g.102489  ORF Transcript_41032/g.102489 Transcript_41032/m.102489 type:complete len:330 (-) Transcript_41032:1379-2368(-)